MQKMRTNKNFGQIVKNLDRYVNLGAAFSHLAILIRHPAGYQILSALHFCILENPVSCPMDLITMRAGCTAKCMGYCVLIFP